VTLAASDQEPTPKKLRQPARIRKAVRAGAPPVEIGPGTTRAVEEGRRGPAPVVTPPSEEAPFGGGPGGPHSEGHDSAEIEDSAEIDTQEPDSVEGGLGGAERVVLAIGSTYFHDGRVSTDGYASDLAPTFLGAVAASHTLLRELFKELGAPEQSPIEARCDQWRLQYGNSVDQAQFSVAEESASNGAGARTTSGVGEGTDGWVRGLVAARDADHAQALVAFETEATEAAEAGAPQRAAIAYRAAAAAAHAAGRGDHANRLQRLAGKAYLEIAEKADTLPQGVFMAYREGARSFLEAGNLPLAHKCLSKAIAIGETLGYTE